MKTEQEIREHIAFIKAMQREFRQDTIFDGARIVALEWVLE